MTWNNQNQRKQARQAYPVVTRLSHVPACSFFTRLAMLAFFLCTLFLGGCGKSAAPRAAQTSARSRVHILTYVAIGASDTFGVGADDPYTDNWPSQLTALLKQQVHLINLGVPGMTVHTALSAELPVALDAHPDLVTIWLAVNDLATNVPVGDYSRDLDTLLSRLQAAAPRARIEVGNVPDLTSVPFFSSYNPLTLRQEITAYNDAIDRIVGRHRVILVNLSGEGYNLQEFPQYISSDGLHPSSIGYLQLAQLFYEALQKK